MSISNRCGAVQWRGRAERLVGITPISTLSIADRRSRSWTPRGVLCRRFNAVLTPSSARNVYD